MIKNAILIIIMVLSFGSNISHAKDKLKKYTLGYYITNNNDTIKGYLKNLTVSQSCNRIKYKKDNDTRPTELYPEDVKFYKRGGSIFVSKNISNDGISNKVFVRPVVKGELSHYKRWVTRQNSSNFGANPSFNSANFGSGTREVEINYIELQGKPMLRIRKLNFRSSISSYLSDNEALAEKIMNKELKSIRLIIYEYNTWFRNKEKKTIVSPNSQL